MLKDDNPDKGTETMNKCNFLTDMGNKLKDDNPDKGTETQVGVGSSLYLSLKDDNPDKGTETIRRRFSEQIIASKVER